MKLRNSPERLQGNGGQEVVFNDVLFAIPTVLFPLDDVHYSSSSLTRSQLRFLLSIILLCMTHGCTVQDVSDRRQQDYDDLTS